MKRVILKTLKNTAGLIVCSLIFGFILVVIDKGFDQAVLLPQQILYNPAEIPVVFKVAILFGPVVRQYGIYRKFLDNVCTDNPPFWVSVIAAVAVMFGFAWITDKLHLTEIHFWVMLVIYAIVVGAALDIKAENIEKDEFSGKKAERIREKELNDIGWKYPHGDTKPEDVVLDRDIERERLQQEVWNNYLKEHPEEADELRKKADSLRK